MDLDQLKRVIDQMDDEARFFTAAYLKHLAAVDDSERQKMLGERMRRMDQGKKYTLEQALRLHEGLEAEGL